MNIHFLAKKYRLILICLFTFFIFNCAGEDEIIVNSVDTNQGAIYLSSDDKDDDHNNENIETPFETVLYRSSYNNATYDNILQMPVAAFKGEWVDGTLVYQKEFIIQNNDDWQKLFQYPMPDGTFYQTGSPPEVDFNKYIIIGVVDGGPIYRTYIDITSILVKHETVQINAKKFICNSGGIIFHANTPVWHFVKIKKSVFENKEILFNREIIQETCI